MIDSPALELRETFLSPLRSTFLAIFCIITALVVPIFYVAQADKPTFFILSFLFLLGLAASWIMFCLLSATRIWRICTASLEINDAPKYSWSILAESKSVRIPFSNLHGYSIGEPEVYPGIRNRKLIVWFNKDAFASIVAPARQKWSAEKHAFIDSLLNILVKERVPEIDITRSSFWTTTIGKCISALSLLFLCVFIIIDLQADPPMTSTQRFRLYGVLAPVILWIAAKSFIRPRPSR